jgi:hypothetical protein
MKRAAFTSLEVVIALFILALMTLMFVATLPIATYGARYGNSYATAASLVNHKINQLEEVGYYAMDGTQLLSKGIVDSSTPMPTANPNGMTTATLEFTDVDKLWKFFAQGQTTGGARHTGTDAPTGTIAIAPYTPSVVTVSGTNIAKVIQATVTVAWTPSGRPRSEYSVTTLIPRKK